MRITDREKKVLGYVHIEANAAIKDIGRATGFREHVVRHCLKRLSRVGLDRPLPFIDPFVLGYGEHAAYLCISPESRRGMGALLLEARESKRLAWAACYGGTFDFGLGLWGRSLGDTARELDLLLDRHAVVCTKRLIAPRSKLVLYRRRHLAKLARVKTAHLCAEEGSPVVSLESAYFEALHCIGNESYESLNDLARKMGVAVSTLCYRVRRMEEDGIVRGWYHPITSRSLGLQGMKLLVHLGRSNAALRSSFEAFCQRNPRVIELAHSSGAWDYEIGLEVEHPEQSLEVVDSIHAQFKEVQRCETLTVLSEKRISAFPLGASARVVN